MMNATNIEIKKMAQEAFMKKFGFPPLMKDIAIKEKPGRETFLSLTSVRLCTA
ncbi:MAG: hypothetical protein ACLSA6_02295 [Holdemania massiliensis]